MDANLTSAISCASLGAHTTMVSLAFTVAEKRLFDVDAVSVVARLRIDLSNDAIAVYLSWPEY
jgi:hypothetical protein